VNVVVGVPSEAREGGGTGCGGPECYPQGGVPMRPKGGSGQAWRGNGTIVGGTKKTARVRPSVVSRPGSADGVLDVGGGTAEGSEGMVTDMWLKPALGRASYCGGGRSREGIRTRGGHRGCD